MLWSHTWTTDAYLDLLEVPVTVQSQGCLSLREAWSLAIASHLEA